MADRFRGVVRGGLGGEELAEPVFNHRVPVVGHPPSWTWGVVKSCIAEWTQVRGAARVPAQYAGAKRRVHLSGSSSCLEGLEHDSEQQAGLLSLVGHPGLEPGANGLRTQRLASKKPLFLALFDNSTRSNVATSGHSGPRDRYDRASLIAKIHAALASV
jgi:hypothetical protein